MVTSPWAIVTDNKNYEVTGELTPDMTGAYEDTGEFNDKRYYYRPPVDGFIWWTGLDRWIISQMLGDTSGAFWHNISPNIEGIYDPQGGALGDATVTEI